MKSIEILKVSHNYESQGRHVLLLTSALDNRTKIGAIASRIGMQREAIAVHDVALAYYHGYAWVLGYCFHFRPDLTYEVLDAV